VTRRHEDIFDRSIDVQVLRLRRKLEVDPRAAKVVRAERGIGYLFLHRLKPSEIYGKPAGDISVRPTALIAVFLIVRLGAGDPVWPENTLRLQRAQSYRRSRRGKNDVAGHVRRQL
jgi:Transcriptional regulatory protein, C terminal